LTPLSGIVISEKSLQVAARNIARALGDEISVESPLLDSRLPDGGRVAIALSPISVGGTALAIRKCQNQRFQADELVRIGTLSQDALKLLHDAVLNREAILISGGTGTGKTTLLNALANSIPDEERIGIIEDTAEIHIEKPDWFRLEARREQPDLRPVTIRDLLKITLRMRPDRILLGEVRGAEAFDLLQAMNTGHQGTLSTIHANTATATLTRFISYIMMAGIEIPYRSLRSNIADVVSVIVHIERRNGKRSVDEILRIHGYDPMEDRYALQTIYTRQPEANL
jgi:pilus assembly protein CpaF